MKTQVVIIGAGPTGLSMAVHLMRYGIDFIILDKKEGPTKLSKAIVVQARTLEIFEEEGLAAEAIRRGKITSALNMFHRGRCIAFFNLSGLGEGISPYPFALSLEQSKTEELLVETLTSGNKEVCWNTEFTGLTQDENSVRAVFVDSSGKELIVEAEYLVGCDGAGSPVRHQLGMTFGGDTVPKLFYVADVRLNSPVINRNELYVFLIDKGFVLFFPMEGAEHYRIVGILPDADMDGDQYTFEEIAPAISEHIATDMNVTEVRWFSTYKVHSRKANEFGKGRCFIAGDAAHIHTPAGGQGMNTGIQDAYNLAWKLAWVLKGSVKPEILQTYNSERGENARNLLRTTDNMFEIIAGTTGLKNFFRLKLFPVLARWIVKSKFVRSKIFPLISQTGISYSSNLILNSSVGKVKAGVRMPYFVLPDGKSIYELLSAPAFKVIYFGKNPNTVIHSLSELKFPVESISLEHIPEKLFGANRDFYVLLRPDNHISYIGKDVSKCSELLSSISVF